MNILKSLACVVQVILSVPSAFAGESQCPINYFSGTTPDIVSEKLAARTVEVCKEGFGIVHSGLTATPLWSAELLTAQRIVDAKSVDRVDQFHPEPMVPASDRAELRHYKKSGFDRGHLSPSADMATVQSQADSFTLANMIPQQPDLNRKLWAHIEATARGLALGYGDVYVVTGAAFVGQSLKQIGGRVLVPSAVYKAIYIPKLSVAAAWWAPNVEPGTDYEVISINELTSRSGVDVFPQLDPAIKARGAQLPAPKASNDRIR